MKAVIMAGGEGSRMRPLTCDVPKPMLRLCGKPALEYIFDLLYKNDCNEAVLTLRYLSDEIKEYVERIQAEGKYGGMKISFVEETECLGTAGSVKAAAANFKEPFLVISGDAVCDFNLKNFSELHNTSNNEVSILLTKVNDPREYGLVTLTSLGKVNSFIEKPGWSRAVSEFANTGIYYINHSVLSYIPENTEYDFSKDLFPSMMKKGKIIGGFNIDGYWCDIGDFASYIKCQTDLILKRAKSNLNISESYVCTNDGKIPGGRYRIIPPVFIGDHVTIGDGSVIGPGSVIDNGCVIGSNVHVKTSIVLENSKVESNARITGGIVASGSTIKNGSVLFDGAVLGSSSVLGDRSTILQNVLVWPKKIIPPAVRVYENIVVQPPERDLFDDIGVCGSADAELVPEVCAKLGKACASLKTGIKIGVSTDGTRTAKVLKMAIQSGAMASGAYIWDFGESFMSQLPFFTSFCGLDMGIFIKTMGDPHGNNASLTFCGPDGLPLPRFKERNIENRVLKSDFRRSEINKGRDISNITSIRMIYNQELCRNAKNTLEGMAVSVDSENPEISRILRECLDRVGCTYSDNLTVNINADGTELTMTERNYAPVLQPTLLAICCNHDFRESRDVALPANAPEIIDDIAKMYSRRVLRYFESSSDGTDETARRLAACQPWSKDALFMCFKILSIMHDRNKSLHELVDEIPKFYISDKEMPLYFSPVKLKDIFKEDLRKTAFASEGVTVSGKGAKALLTPSKKGNRIKILVEADNMETAEEFSADISRKINQGIQRK